jgi:hypothetical protein
MPPFGHHGKVGVKSNHSIYGTPRDIEAPSDIFLEFNGKITDDLLALFKYRNEIDLPVPVMN